MIVSILQLIRFAPTNPVNSRANETWKHQVTKIWF